MVYGSTANIKTILGQAGTVNDSKIAEYQLLAYNWINSHLFNIETTLPIPSPDAYILSFEDSYSAALFYKFESGDSVLADSLEKQFMDIYMRQKYHRPSFITRPSV